MAESLAQRLQRIAREKAASAVGGASAPVAQPTQAQVTEEVSDVKQDGMVSVQETSGGTEAGTGSNDGAQESIGAVGESTDPEAESLPALAAEIQVTDNNIPAVVATESKPTSTHPLAMAFAELEAGLLARDPEFKTKLRDIHRHLGREPELVTQMTEAEIALIVTGMVVFANAEIVEPAAKKAGKAAVKAASKVVISADDL